MGRSYDNDSGCSTTVGLWTLVIAIIVLFLWLQASQEASTYNRLTGANVTTWDALWIDLRVQDNTIEKQHKRTGE